MTVRDQTQERAADRPLGRLLLAQFNAVSNAIAGGQRIDVNEVLPTGERWNPLEGMLPDEVTFPDQFDPATFAMADPNRPDSFNLANIPAAGTGAGREGKGLDWFRAGQAPDNYANRNNPLYRARADFVSKHVAPTIAEAFPGMTVTGQGYYRPPGGGGGQAKNSDHQSAGALDVFGTPEEMAALREWAVTQPWVSFVRCNSEHHYDHVHLSVDIGWVAHNYFSGGTVPDMKVPSQETMAAPELPETEQPGPIVGEGGTRVV